MACGPAAVLELKDAEEEIDDDDRAVTTVLGSDKLLVLFWSRFVSFIVLCKVAEENANDMLEENLLDRIPFRF